MTESMTSKNCKLEYGHITDQLPKLGTMKGLHRTSNFELCFVHSSLVMPILTYRNKAFILDINDLIELARLAGLFNTEVKQ